MFETLEGRMLLSASATLSGGTVFVVGTANDDHVTIQVDANDSTRYQVSIDDGSYNVWTFLKADVQDFSINTYGGNDDVFVTANNGSVSAERYADLGDGDDTYRGVGGYDDVDGGAGNDTLEGGSSDDQLRGDDGDDVFIFSTSASASADSFRGGAGADRVEITGSSGADAMTLSSARITDGSNYADLLSVETVALSTGDFTVSEDLSTREIDNLVAEDDGTDVIFDSDQELVGLTITNADVAIGTSHVLRITGSLTLNDENPLVPGEVGASLDVGTGGFIIDESAITESRLVDLLDEGYGYSGLTALGIYSDETATNVHRTVGWGYDEDVQLSTYRGEVLGTSDILVRFTYSGDVTLNGFVDMDDNDIIIANFGTTGKTWSEGDVTYEGDVDLDDVDKLINTFGDLPILV